MVRSRRNSFHPLDGKDARHNVATTVRSIGSRRVGGDKCEPLVCFALRKAPVAIGLRSTAYQIGAARRLSPAVEIYIYRRGSDPARLLRLLEAIILRENLTPSR